TGGGNQQFVEQFYKNIFQKYPFGLNSTTELDIRITGGNIWPSFTEQYKIDCKDCKVEISPLIGLRSNPAFVGAPPTREYGSPQTYTYADPIIIPTATINQLGTISNISKNIIPAGLLCKAQDDQFWQKFSTSVDVASIAFGGYYLYLGRAANAVNALRRTHRLEGILGIASGSGNLFIKSGNCSNKVFCDALSNVLTMIGYMEIGLGVKDLVTSAFYKQLDEQVDAVLQGPELKNVEGSAEITKVLEEASKTLKAIKTHLDPSDLINLKPATSVSRSDGGRAFNGVKSLVNEGKAIVLVPNKGSLLAQRVDAYVAANKSADYQLQGQIGEEITTIIAKEANPNGFITNGKVNNSDNGFDVLSFAPNKDNPTSLSIFESKPLNGNSVVLSGTSNGPQMSDPWIASNVSILFNSTDPLKKALGNSLNVVLNNGKTTKFVVSVDKELKQVIIIKIDY
ncbi:MAG TPA: hypothetical protein PKD85_13940, partial [Saprospiraceae bacterium]|nr:hypothetical protein [Saprospiraceae bacterium]